MTQYSLYDPSTGRFVGVTIGCHPSLIHMNTPAGLSAVEGCHDPDASRVVLVDDGYGNVFPSVVSAKPRRPADSDNHKHVFDEALDCWVPVATHAGVVARLMASRNRLLRATDDAARAGIERLLVAIAGSIGVVIPPDVAALLEYRQRLRDAPADPSFHAFTDADLSPPEPSV